MASTYYWIPNQGYTWRMPGSAKQLGAESFNINSNEEQADALRLIKAQIDIGRPPLIDIGPIATASHTVFCYGYIANATSFAKILVCDPANTDRTSQSGRKVSLHNAMTDYEYNYNGITYEQIRNVRLTYPA